MKTKAQKLAEAIKSTLRFFNWKRTAHRGVKHGRSKVNARSYSDYPGLRFIDRGITPVTLPSYCNNKPLASTLRHQQSVAGGKMRIIWNAGTRYGSFPKD